MPVITIEAAKLSKEQKKMLVTEVTSSASSIMNVPESAFIVLVKENELENIGVAGQLLADR
ncbi:4-oxalocrotonate tautomerase DmpI [Paenibacillus sp. IHBB 3054]|uniref:4-oxalocrotonate tautomerase DmpI n=1 Tax=Paenibacillus sp. IHBB 3054 TaxID=3425689 RepID=UPI003F6748C8